MNGQFVDATELSKLLSIGGRPPHGTDVHEAGFRVLMLCSDTYQPPDSSFPGVHVVRRPFMDRPFSVQPEAQDLALEAGDLVHKFMSSGARCLVTCNEGRNRSGLVCAIALAESGMDPLAASQLIRDRRLGALTNMDFRGLLDRIQKV
jgi:protein-tyrosine phosphatase